MPTEFGSAPLDPLTLTATGIFGLNTQASNTILPPQWATKADNLIYDSTNRLATRLGWTALNSTPMTGSPTVGQIFEYMPVTGSNQIVSTGGNKLWSGTTTLTNITGALTVTADNWKFVNFNGNVYGLQANHPLIVWTGSGNFTTVTAASGTVPNGNELLSAFGHLWGTDSTGQVLKYSALLDATNWTTGAGSFNFASVWGQGNDAIVALAAFNNLLVVFGSRNIIILEDQSSTGSPLGLNPINAAVVDLIPGVGCVARDTVQNCGGDDLVFLSYNGLQSLKRIFVQRSNPLHNISANVRDFLSGTWQLESPSNLRSTYNAVNGVYILSVPAANTAFVFDNKLAMQDGTWRVTTWSNIVPTALLTLHDNGTLYGGKAGQILQYTGNIDLASPFTSEYQSGWLNLGDEANNREKILKRIVAIYFYTGQPYLTYKWAYDFQQGFTIYPSQPSNTGAQALWNVGQWGIDSWGGGAQQLEERIAGSSAGQYIKVGLAIVNNNSSLALNQLQLYTKIGRYV